MKLFSSAAPINSECVTTKEITQNIHDLFRVLEKKTAPNFPKLLAPIIQKAQTHYDPAGNNALILLLSAGQKNVSSHKTPRASQTLPSTMQTHLNAADRDYIDAISCLLGAESNPLKYEQPYQSKDLLNSVTNAGQTPLTLAIQQSSTSNHERHKIVLNLIQSCDNLRVEHSISCLTDKHPQELEMLDELLILYSTKEQERKTNHKNAKTTLKTLHAHNASLSYDLQHLAIDDPKTVEIEQKQKEISTLTVETRKKYEQTKKQRQGYEKLSITNSAYRALDEVTEKLLENTEFSNNLRDHEKYHIVNQLIAMHNASYDNQKKERHLNCIEHMMSKGINPEIMDEKHFINHFLINTNVSGDIHLLDDLSHTSSQVIARLCLYQHDGWQHRLDTLLESGNYQIDEEKSTEADFSYEQDHDLDHIILDPSNEIKQRVIQTVHRLRQNLPQYEQRIQPDSSVSNSRRETSRQPKFGLDGTSQSIF